MGKNQATLMQQDTINHSHFSEQINKGAHTTNLTIYPTHVHFTFLQGRTAVLRYLKVYYVKERLDSCVSQESKSQC